VRLHHITKVSHRKITAAERRKINPAPCPRYKFCFVCSRSSSLLLPTNIAAENEGTGHSIPSVVWYCCYIDNSHRGTAEPSSVNGGSGDCERTYIFRCLCRNKTHLPSPDPNCFSITSIVPLCFARAVLFEGASVRKLCTCGILFTSPNELAHWRRQTSSTRRRTEISLGVLLFLSSLIRGLPKTHARH
jgi:hypothetical protein